MAAPVFDHSGALASALIVLGYSKPFEAQAESISAALRDQAGALSRRLGAPETTDSLAPARRSCPGSRPDKLRCNERGEVLRHGGS